MINIRYVEVYFVGKNTDIMSVVMLLWAASSNIPKSDFLSVVPFFVDLRTKSEFCPIRHSVTGFL